MNPALQTADRQVLRRLYHLVSVDPARVRARLRLAGKVFASPDDPSPDPVALRESAEWMVHQASQRTATVGGLIGLVGMFSIPHEVVLHGCASIRLAQRLAVVYGLDPGTDRGKTAIWQALSAALDVVLPEHGMVHTRVSDLPAVLGIRPTRTVSSRLLQALATVSTRDIATRPSRWLPGAAAALNASHRQRLTLHRGALMIEVFERLAPPPAPTGWEDAVEIA